MSATSFTRGHGLLEPFLSRKRSDKADTLIDPALRAGAVLDIGCGSWPLFLSRTSFNRKVGIDRLATPQRIAELRQEGLEIVNHDVESNPQLPFADKTFDVVTMLAVFEHILPESLERLVAEIHRVLKPGGQYVLTTPAAHAEWLLNLLSALHLLSAEEVEEHKHTYTAKEMRDLVIRAGFPAANVAQGTFECGLNLWLRAHV